MELRIQSPVLALQRGEMVTLDDARGMRIRARHGLLWVTEEGNARDHILGAGETLTVGHGGRTVVQALQAAWVSIRPGDAAANDP